jgi:HD-GYP domain-containing protein (c-di-GMP phosphodiesterase class II)
MWYTFAFNKKEIEKYILSDHPSQMIEDNDFHDIFKSVLMLKEVPQDTKAHPEHENVFVHIARAMDDAAKIADTEGLSEDDRLVLIFASLFHDIVKETA